jgi:L-2-hydroxycarboxylate dehydrogenase (NAD+)
MVREAALFTAGVLTAVLVQQLHRHWKRRCSKEPLFTPPQTLRVPLDRLQMFSRAIFIDCGLSVEDATTAAEVLVLADLRGIDSHGVARLPAYFTMLRQGKINPRPDIRIVRETASTATVDGDNGLGLVVGPRANAIAMDKASAAGSGWVAVKNTNHYGIAGSYSLRALERDMIGLSMTNSSAVVAPLWGRSRMLGTNPIAIAFPAATEKPVVIDLATSAVPWGRVEEYARMQRPLHPGWTIGADGQPCADADEVLASGALMNLGGARETSGHKGFCLAAMVDVLSAVLSGGNWGPTVDGFTAPLYAHAEEDQDGEGRQGSGGGGGGSSGGGGSGGDAGQSDGPAKAGAEGKLSTGIAHFFGALRIDGFRDVNAFKRSMDAWITAFRAAPPVNDGRPVLVPGDPEWTAVAERTKGGVPVKLTVLADLLDVARACGVPPPFDESAVDLSGVRRSTVLSC